MMNIAERESILQQLKERDRLQVNDFLKMQADEVAISLKEGLVEPNDFRLQCNKFLDKMKHSSSFELVKSIKKFISNFIKESEKPLPTERHVEEVRKFLEDTSVTISKHVLWKGLSSEELEIATEGLERYVMHKIHEVAYCPNREDDHRKDCEFAYKVRSLGFVTAQHLDVDYGQFTEMALEMACKELERMGTYKSPRDKVTAVMNCCKIICNLLKDGSKGHTRGADDILPLLILTLIWTRPPSWWSDIRYIQRYRNPTKLSSEEGYYLTQMSGAVQFIEKAKASSFNGMSERQFVELSSEYLNRSSPPPRSLSARHSSDLPSTRQQSKPGESLTPTIKSEESSQRTETFIVESEEKVESDEARPVLTEKFLVCQFEDMTVSELRQLFEEYRCLAQIFHASSKEK
ncbi:uncharacterized protein [Oscarella lobularis]|uniref:uncharacterized protein n=1 Tax=Oscarella lobularis TaxID=121494 RepID=UPI0033143F52